MIERSETTNHLLAILAQDDFERLVANGSVVTLKKGVDLITPNDLIKFCWFPLSGIVSIIAQDSAGNEAEVGLVGLDGLVDTSVVLGDTQAALRALVQIEGTALRVSVADLQSVMLSSPAVTALMLAYVRAFSLQLVSSALAFARYPIEQRLARWALMCADRVGNHIALTHEALSIMLGVRRAGISVTLRRLESRGLIAMTRGGFFIVDRPALLALAGSGYGIAEAAYRRLVISSGTQSVNLGSSPS